MGPVDQEISRSSSRASKPALRLLASVALALHLAAHAGRGQELEPRALTNVPVGTDFVALGYGYAQGNIFLDPAIPVEDLDSKLQTFVGARARAIDFFGLSSKLDLMVPPPLRRRRLGRGPGGGRRAGAWAGRDEVTPKRSVVLDRPPARWGHVAFATTDGFACASRPKLRELGAARRLFDRSR